MVVRGVVIEHFPLVDAHLLSDLAPAKIPKFFTENASVKIYLSYLADEFKQRLSAARRTNL